VINLLEHWRDPDNLEYLIHRLVNTVCDLRNPVIRETRWTDLRHFCSAFSNNKYLHPDDYFTIEEEVQKHLPPWVVTQLHADVRWRDAHETLTRDEIAADEAHPDLRLAFEAMIDVGAVPEAYQLIRGFPR
jgi:hypothetical protein